MGRLQQQLRRPQQWTRLQRCTRSSMPRRRRPSSSSSRCRPGCLAALPGRRACSRRGGDPPAFAASATCRPSVAAWPCARQVAESFECAGCSRGSTLMCSHAPVPMDCGCYGSPYLLLWSLQHSALVASPDPAHPSSVAQGRGCGVWQHCDCLGLAVPPAKFLCELCRARLADPFWEVTEQVLPPSRLKPTVSGGQGCMRKVAGPLQAGMLLRMQCLVAVGSSGQPWRLASLPCHAWPPAPGMAAHCSHRSFPCTPCAPCAQCAAWAAAGGDEPRPARGAERRPCVLPEPAAAGAGTARPR